MTSPRLRKDAAQNWQQIVDAARQCTPPLRLNEVARAASVGVATVYRHFPTPEALLETLARPHLEEMTAHAERALGSDDAWDAFRGFFVAGIDAQLGDASVQPVFAASAHVLPETTGLVTRLHALASELLDRARAAGAVRPDVTHADVTRLMCGVVYAATVHATADERPALTRHYLDVVLRGLRA
ncbi:TetR/AcrR family transcriptional regulator [Cryptosporangium sp. NPDC051539]|uniref:TetR/AcrR family transcriptional regulator n=1 Tax=Cryptosporangium sp. NPDC051539 TaxID=3363962 RepID=UPI003792FF65